MTINRKLYLNFVKVLPLVMTCNILPATAMEETKAEMLIDLTPHLTSQDFHPELITAEVIEKYFNDKTPDNIQDALNLMHKDVPDLPKARELLENDMATGVPCAGRYLAYLNTVEYAQAFNNDQDKIRQLYLADFYLVPLKHSAERGDADAMCELARALKKRDLTDLAKMYEDRAEGVEMYMREFGSGRIYERITQHVISLHWEEYDKIYQERYERLVEDAKQVYEKSVREADIEANKKATELLKTKYSAEYEAEMHDSKLALIKVAMGEK